MSVADSGSSVQPLRLMLDKGVGNRRSFFIENPRLLREAKNVEYRLGDNAIYAAKQSRLVNEPAAINNTYRSLGVFSLDDALDVGIAVRENIGVGVGTINQASVYVPIESGTETVLSPINTEDHSYAPYWPAPVLVQYGTDIYILTRAEMGETQRISFADPVNPELKRWGGPWYAFRQDGDTHGYTGTRLRMECEWCWGKPYNPVGASGDDEVALVRLQREGETDYNYKFQTLGGWMQTGPDADPTSTIEQHNYGHLFPDSNIDESDALEYDIWVTEWDDVNKIESSFQVDVSKIEYEPRHFSHHQEYALKIDRAVNINTDQTNSVHRLYQTRRRAPLSTGSFDWTTAPDPLRRSTAGDSVGGLTLMCRIKKTYITSQLHPDTTHIRIYMSRRGGSFPEGSRVKNSDLMVAFDYSGLTSSDTEATCGKANTSTELFVNLPNEEPGIPVDTLTVAFEEPTTADTSAHAAWDKIQNVTTLNLWNADDDLHVYIVRPTEEFQTLGSDLFPTVESTINGEGYLLVPQDAPPPKATFGVTFNNSIVTDDVANPGLVRWSGADLPGSFPASYFYDMNDAFVAARKLGRYLMLFGKNKLVLARYLTYDDVSAEATAGAFLEIDSTRGARSFDLTCSFTHPSLGPSVAFVDNAGELWMSNGSLPRQMTPQFEFGKDVVIDWDNAALINNPAEQRLELFFQEPNKINSTLPQTASAYYAISYHPMHTLSDEVASVMGPIEFDSVPSVSSIATGKASSANGSYWLAANGKVYQTSGTDNGVPSDLTTSVVSQVINPVGLSKDWMIYSLRVAHRFTDEPATLQFKAYDHGGQTYDSHVMDLPTSPDPSVTHHNAQFTSEGVQLVVDGWNKGALDAVEVDVDPGVGPLSD